MCITCTHTYTYVQCTYKNYCSNRVRRFLCAHSTKKATILDAEPERLTETHKTRVNVFKAPSLKMRIYFFINIENNFIEKDYYLSNKFIYLKCQLIDKRLK